MALYGWVSEGNADRILEVVREDYFPPNFVEYLRREEFKWSRHSLTEKLGDSSGSIWVLWSQQDHEIEPSLSLAIRHALHKLVLGRGFNYGQLVQFWAAAKTLEGRTKLTTQHQPFVLGHTEFKKGRQRLCEYRMICREYSFYADTQSGEEQLGLPGRVFLHKLPESAPSLGSYSKMEYLQLDPASSCNSLACFALPVFERFSHNCIGVVEIVTQGYDCPDPSFLGKLDDTFQEFGLRCIDGYKNCKMQFRGKKEREKELTPAFQELKTVLKSVCRINELDLAMTWVPCSDCNDLQCAPCFMDVGSRSPSIRKFLRVSECSHLRKSWVAERARSYPYVLCCSDITQFSVDEYPLVPYARKCKFSSWFTVCLQSSCTKDDIYVLEFFSSASSEDNVDILTKLSRILGTMQDKFKTFRLASGQELGEILPVEVIYFQNGQKIFYPEMIQATFFPSPKSDLGSEQSSDSLAITRPGFQDAKKVSFKVKHPNYPTIKFNLSLPCRLVDLQKEVARRLPLEAGSYRVMWNKIDCDEDLQTCVDTSKLLGNTSTVVFLEPVIYRDTPTDTNGVDHSNRRKRPHSSLSLLLEPIPWSTI